MSFCIPGIYQPQVGPNQAQQPGCAGGINGSSAIKVLQPVYPSVPMKTPPTLNHPVPLSCCTCWSLRSFAVMSARFGTSASRQKQQGPSGDSIWAHEWLGLAYLACRHMLFPSFRTTWAHPALRLRSPTAGAVSGFLVNLFSGFPQNYLIWGVSAWNRVS